MDKVDELLDSWEEIYKRGQLTFWILLALQDFEKTVDEIQNFIETITDGTFVCETQSLYRALRRFQDTGLVSNTAIPGNRGPDKKLYAIESPGQELLTRFVQRNIEIYYKDGVEQLIRSQK